MRYVSSEADKSLLHAVQDFVTALLSRGLNADVLAVGFPTVCPLMQELKSRGLYEYLHMSSRGKGGSRIQAKTFVLEHD